jgi:hypothetical protein
VHTRLLQRDSVCDLEFVEHIECAHVAFRSDFVIGESSEPDSLF